MRSLDVGVGIDGIVTRAARRSSSLPGHERGPVAVGRSERRGSDSVVTIGASRIRFSAKAADGPPAARRGRPRLARRDDPWRLTLHRPPRQPAAWASITDRATGSGPGASAALGRGAARRALSVVGGVVLAIVLGHPMYLIFSCVGFAAAVGSALSRRVGDRKRRRRLAAESRARP